MRTIKTASKEDLQMLYNDSAFTYVWLLDEAKEYESLENFLFDNCKLKKPEEVIMYKASGWLVNDTFELEWKNRFPRDLNIVLMPLSNFSNDEIWRLAIIKLQIWARRFDDIINNSKPELNDF
jgi:hypothetical protein